MLAYRALPKDSHHDYETIAASEKVRRILRSAKKAIKKIRKMPVRDRYVNWDKVLHHSIGYQEKLAPKMKIRLIKCDTDK